MESEVKQKYFEFKGIEIDGDLQSFCDKLVAIGYCLDLSDDNPTTTPGNSLAFLTGTFAGKDDCKIMVVESKLINKVWLVVVDLPVQACWSLIKQEYGLFKSICQKKYGEPKSFEYFTTPYSEGDGKEMEAIMNDMCDYKSFWIMKGGAVILSITNEKQVSISYEDAINCKLRIAAEEEAASLDI